MAFGRLTAEQYKNAVASLLHTSAPGSVALPAEGTVNGFENQVTVQKANFGLVDAWQVAAAELSESADLKKISPCLLDTAGQTTCVNEFLKSFGRRAFRRPLDADEVGRYMDFYGKSQGTHGHQTAVRMIIAAILQSPSFLYNIESDGTGSSDVFRLSGFAVANRLALLLTANIPDDALLDAAEAGELDDEDGVRKHAQRLLASDEGHRAVAGFHERWLHLKQISGLTKDATLYPWWNDATSEALRASASAFVERAFWDGDSLQALFTDDQMEVQASTATIFGVDSAAATRLVSLKDRKRSGFLTHPGWLAALAKENQDNPVTRGNFVLEQLLCAPPPPPPADVNFELPNPKDAQNARTTRQRLEMLHHKGTCGACHRQIDGVGFAFGNYDAVGKWRDDENGERIDARGELIGTDVDGPFDGAAELSERLAGSQQVSNCVSLQWLRWALGRSEDDKDSCTLGALSQALSGSEGGFQKMLSTLVTTPSFLYRARGEK